MFMIEIMTPPKKQSLYEFAILEQPLDECHIHKHRQDIKHLGKSRKQ